MIKVDLVAPDYVYQVWDDVKDFLDASIKTGTGTCTLDQLKLLLAKNYQTLIVGVNEEGNLVGAMTVEFVNYPNARTMFITALGGFGVVTQDIWKQVEDWAKLQGVTKVSAWCEEAQARLYKQKAGFDTIRFVVEKNL
jgi:hypothetical protein